MVDTTVMEYTAEDLISHKLLRRKILVAKPKFDQEGADLLAFSEFKDGAKFIRVQCKGRTVSARSSRIDIPCKYLDGEDPGFLVFLFVEDGEFDQTNLFCFFPEDIKGWEVKDIKGKDNYRLSISKTNFKDDFKNNTFDDQRIPDIKNLIESTNFENELEMLYPQTTFTSGASGRDSKENITQDFDSNSNTTNASREDPNTKHHSKIHQTLGDQKDYKIDPNKDNQTIDKKEL